MAIDTTNGKYYLLSSQARIQVPYIKVTIGKYTFGVFSRETKNKNNLKQYNIEYPNYIQSMSIVKLNGKVNQYTLNLTYPITQFDDPNFFEKVFSSVSNSRKIVFSYGDASMPNFMYKEEEALITKITQSFDLSGSSISYTISAISTCTLAQSGSYTFINNKAIKPSDEIKRLFKDSRYGLQSLFTGMNIRDLSEFIAGDDAYVKVDSKTNISILDYINYLVGCMMPANSDRSTNISKDIYILTIHDDTVYDRLTQNRDLLKGKEITGPYFKITRTSYAQARTDAYTIDVGYNTSTIVTSFSIENNENYSLYYDYQKDLSNNNQYVRRINNEGRWEDVFAPTSTSNNENYITRPEDVQWYTKITKYPINATIMIQGLLRPAQLMQYIRLNVIFPGGHKHMSSGLYIITKQVDTIDQNGYKTQLSLTKISGDDNPTTYKEV